MRRSGALILSASHIVLMSVGLLTMRRATAGGLVPETRLRRLLLLAGTWFLLQLPVHLAAFIAPTGKPSFVLLAGGIGAAIAAVGLSRSRG